jgi:hypothetical protein
MDAEPDDIIADMLAKADAYCERHDISLTRLGILIVNDGKFFTKVRETSNCTIKTYRKVMNWFEENKQPVPKRNGKGNSNRPELLG